MHGTFPEVKPGAPLGGDWGSLLKKEPEEVREKPVQPPPPGVDVVTVYPAPLRFALDERVVYVVSESMDGLRESNKAHWLVPHVLKEVQDKAGTPVNDGAGNVLKRFRPYVDNPTLVREKAEVDSMREFVAYLERMDHKGDPYRVRDGVHVELPTTFTFEVGELLLRQWGELAERLDYKFALRMQGLQNATLKSVWVCTDPDLGGDRREELTKTFTEGFIRDFLAFARVNPGGGGGGRAVDQALQEAVHLYNTLTGAWVDSHRHGLSPHIVASAESLVGLFFSTGLRPFAAKGMTWGEVARFLMREPRFSPHFGLCLHYYMTKMEQDRGGRNASYKAMFNAASGNIMALNAMHAFLAQNRGKLNEAVGKVQGWSERAFHPYFMDWYAIVGQLHPQRKAYAYSHELWT